MSSIRLKKNVLERKKKSLIKMGIVAAVLLILCVAVYMSGDRTAPVLDFTNAASVYYVDEDTNLSTETFLEGVSASDNVDGDLTNRIVVKSMRQNADSSITVTYCVRDNSGNLTTQERIYNISGNATLISTSDNEEDAIAADGDLEEALEETVGEGEAADSDAVESEGEAESVDVEVPAETESVTEAEIVVTDIPAETSTSEPPVIALTTTEARIPTGEALRYNDYIAYLSDDVDSAETLQNYIWIEGYYDIDWTVPGVYTLLFRVTDSDGNLSEAQELTVYVGQD